MKPFLWLALLCHLVLATGYLLRTPAFEGPDENGHGYYASYLVNRHSLPIIENSGDDVGRSSRDESAMGHHPPLYYGVLALTLVVTGNADTVPTWSVASPVGALQWRHGYDEVAPVSGEIAVLRVLRGWSVLFGLVTIVLTWRLARAAFPTRPVVADAAAVLLACLPQFSFMHGVLNCDNLATMLSHAVLLVLAASCCRGRLAVGTGVGLGVLTGLALLSKMTCLFLVPLLGAAYLIALWRWPAQRRQTALSGAALGLVAVAMSGWFFLRNLELYGELLAQTTIQAVTDQQLVPAGRVWEYLTSFFLPELCRSFVGYFGWWRLPVPGWLLAGWAALVAFAVLGWMDGYRRRVRIGAGVWVCLFAALLLFASVLRLNTMIASPQGRYLFPAAGPIMILIAGGLVLLGERFSPRLRAWSRWALPALPLVGLLVLQLHFTPVFRILPPDDPYHASMIADITASPPPAANAAVELLGPRDGAALHAPPTFRWSEPAAGDPPYGLHLFDARGEIWISTEQHGLRLCGGEWTMPAPVWADLPFGQEFFWKVRRLPDRQRGESVGDTPESPVFRFTRVH